MKQSLFQISYTLLKKSLFLALASVSLISAAATDFQPYTSQLELQEYLSSHSYKTPESCPQNRYQGSCWARSIMKILHPEELSQIYNQVARFLPLSKDKTINSAALHLYLESHSAETPEGATPGVPINDLNLQLAILLKKRIMTATPLPNGQVAIQTFTGFADGSYEVEEYTISLSSQPEELHNALLSADISLFLTPGINGQPGHVLPIVFNFEVNQTPEEALLRASLDRALNRIVDRPTRLIDIFTAISGDMPSFFFSGQRFGAGKGGELTQLQRERKRREEAKAKANLEKEAKLARNEAAEKYREGDTARFCKNCAKGAAKLGIIGAAAAATYKKWETVKGYLNRFWNEIIVPQMPLIARMDGMGVRGKAGDIPPELASYMDTLPQKGREAGKYIYSKADNYIRSVWAAKSKNQPTQGFAYQMLTAVNAIRSKPQVCGTTPMSAVGKLRWSHSLEAAAFKHSTDMASRDFMDHTGSDGSQPDQRIEAQGYLWSFYGENVAAGQSSVDEVLKTWMSSEGHCKNIMSPKVIEMGASYVEEAFSGYGIYWTQVFAKPRY
ncbi:CAP domain-containing protein [Endozoicomonas arenosclerae]|uniref:CAP domain-containing protein n=1 Tax=Endozoicomonas arenosclerae TaxID=1633495 RepID=UPI0007866BB2|nr:CAP domain-containing protein [Endozoicomonas arenosclerae]